MTTLQEWAVAWRVPNEALADLYDRVGVGVNPHRGAAGGEKDVQDRVRLAAAGLGWDLWRNNVGVAMDERNIPIRFGLANDSSKLNRKIKSHDLIGIRPIKIDATMVGSTLGQFVSLEIKRPGWQYAGTEREQAQLRWANIVNSAGGHARFIYSEGQLK